jgi:hypothetical protein
MFLFTQLTREGTTSSTSKVVPQNSTEVVMAARSAFFLVLVAAAVVPVSSAAGASYSTRVVVSLRTPAFHGSVKSAKGACATNRTVKLFRKKPGPDKLLGSDKSNANARWSIPIGKLTRGSYYAKAPAKGSCRAGKSKVLTI